MNLVDAGHFLLMNLIDAEYFPPAEFEVDGQYFS